MAQMSQDRQATALERIASALEKMHDKLFPEKKEDSKEKEHPKIIFPDSTVEPESKHTRLDQASPNSGNFTSDPLMETPLGKMPPADKSKVDDKSKSEDKSSSSSKSSKSKED